MGIKEAIEQLESLQLHCASMIPKPKDRRENDVWERDVEALIIALDALRAKV